MLRWKLNPIGVINLVDDSQFNACPSAGLWTSSRSSLERDIGGTQDIRTSQLFLHLIRSVDGTAPYKRWPQINSVPINRTEGTIQREKRLRSQGSLSAQTSISHLSSDIEYRCACMDPRYILVDDPFPCCPQGCSYKIKRSSLIGPLDLSVGAPTIPKCRSLTSIAPPNPALPRPRPGPSLVRFTLRSTYPV